MKQSNDWGWIIWGGSEVHGPFPSREAAVKDAEATVPEYDIAVNTVAYTNFDEVFDNATDFVDMVNWYVRTKFGMLSDWADRWVDAKFECVMQYGERVTVGK